MAKEEDEMVTAIRLSLTVILIYFIYHETGIATTIFAVLTLINSELATIGRNNVDIS